MQGDAPMVRSRRKEKNARAALTAMPVSGQSLPIAKLVICTGIGDGAAQSLQARGIKVMLTGSGAGPAEEAVRAYLAGTLVETFASSCGCHR